MTVSMPPDRDSYFQTVWEIVRQVPRGRVVTFGQIAAMIPPPPGVDPTVYERIAPRWVGYAMNAVSGPDEPSVPWHRVINSRGGISLPAGSQGANLQRARLEAEGVRFNTSGLVNFDVCGWDGPDDHWLRARGLRRPPTLRRGAPPSQLPLL